MRDFASTINIFKNGRRKKEKKTRCVLKKHPNNKQNGVCVLGWGGGGGGGVADRELQNVILHVPVVFADFERGRVAEDDRGA